LVFYGHKTEIAIGGDYKDKPGLVGLLRLLLTLTDTAKFAFRNFFQRKSELLHVFKYVIGKSPFIQTQLNYI